MTREELIEKFCKVLNATNLGPFEKTVYTEMIFIDKVPDKEIELLIRELKRLA